MGYFVGSAQTNGSGAATSLACNVPPHQTNDILIAIVTVDSGTATIAGSTWNQLPSSPASPVTSGTIVYLKYLKAASANETLTLTTGDAYTVGIYVFRDIDGTTPFDGVTPSFAAVAASSTPTTVSVTTTTADCLIFHAICQDGSVPQVLSDPGVMFIDQFDATGTTATTSSHQAAAWYIQRTAGACPTSAWTSNQSSAYVRISFAMRNAASGRIPAYIDDSTAPATRLTCGQHIATLNNISYTAAGAGTLTGTVNGKTVTVAAAVDGADFGINVYANAVTNAAAQTAATALVGPELVLTGGRNASTGLIMGSVIAGTPKMGAFGLGTLAQGGIIIRIGSAATAWNAYQVAARDSLPAPDQRTVFAIQAGSTGSQYAQGTTGITASSLTYIQFLRNAPSFSSQTYYSEIHLVGTQIAAGGNASFPVDVNGMVEIGKSFRLPVIQKAGPSGLLSYAPIQIGGGDAVNFQIDAGSLQFPRRADATVKEVAFHGADNTLGISLAGKSGDVIKFTNSVITSPTPYYFNINAAATSAATWDLSGLVLVNANVTLRNVMTFTGMSFSSCPSLDFTGCTVTESVINKVPTTNNSLTVNTSTVISNSTIDASRVTSGNYWVSTTTPSIFSGCAFTGGGGHAIRITTPGTYSFVGNTFTGFGVDGSNGAAIFNDSGGAVTLNVTSGGTTPTIRNGTGASTTVNANVSVTVTGLKNPSEVRVYNAGTTTEIAGQENVTTGSFNFSVGSGVSVDISVLSLGYQNMRILAYSTASDATLPVSQQVDRQYANP